MASALLAADLSDLRYAIEHVSLLLLLKVDSTREYTFREHFPQPITIGERWIWFRDEVLDWLSKQPRNSVAAGKRLMPLVSRRRRRHTARTSVVPRRRHDRRRQHDLGSPG